MAFCINVLYLVASLSSVGKTASLIDSTDSATTILWWTAAAPFHRLKGCFHLKYTRDNACEEYCERKGHHYGFCSDFICSCLNKFNAPEFDLDSILKQPAANVRNMDKILATSKSILYVPRSNAESVVETIESLNFRK